MRTPRCPRLTAIVRLIEGGVRRAGRIPRQASVIGHCILAKYTTRITVVDEAVVIGCQRRSFFTVGRDVNDRAEFVSDQHSKECDKATHGSSYPLEGIERSPGLEKGFLNKVLGRGRIASGETAGKPIDGVQMCERGPAKRIVPIQSTHWRSRVGIRLLLYARARRNYSRCIAHLAIDKSRGPTTAIRLGVQQTMNQGGGAQHPGIMSTVGCDLEAEW